MSSKQADVDTMHGSSLNRHHRRHGVASLQERDPSLLGLPISINLPSISIPIIDPLVTALIGDLFPTHTKTTAPAATTTASSSSGGNSGGSGSSGDSGGSGGSGGSSSGSGNTGGSGSSSGSGGDDGSSSGGGDSGGGGSSSGSGDSGNNGSSGSGDSGSSGSGSSNGGNSNSDSSSGSSPEHATTGVAASSSSIGSGSVALPGGSVTGSSAPSATSITGSASPVSGTDASIASGNAAVGSATNGAIQTVTPQVENFAAAPAVSSPSPTVVGATQTAASSLGTAAAPSNLGNTGSNGSNGGSTSTNPSDPTTSNAAEAASSGSHLSAGTLAGIIVGVLLLTVLVVFCLLRRRSKARRAQRRSQWFADRQPVESTRAATRISARSSFGTPFEQRFSFNSPPDSTAPGSPSAAPLVAGSERVFSPMAQYAPVAVMVSPTYTTSTRDMDGHHRASVFTVASTMSSSSTNSGDDPESQYLSIPAPAVIAPNQTNLIGVETPTTPMSVRPFSPSESFAFPKPPGLLRQSLQDMQDPFGDNSSFNISRVSIAATAPRSSHPPSISSAQNPFADSASVDTEPSPISDIVPGIPHKIFRPFAPTLVDELAVEVGEEVLVLQAFDDGWAQVRKGERGPKGLVPLDCFREHGENIPAFLASKRVSSFFVEAL